MKAIWANKVIRGLLLAVLIAAGMGLAGCADEYAARPGYYRGGYYANSAPYPYYGGYGYPYRTYGPYYGGYYGAPYYGHAPYYGGGSVVISGSRSYVSGGRSYVYRDRYGRLHRTNAVNRTRQPSQRTIRTRTQTTRVPQDQNDDEQRYYNPR